MRAITKGPEPPSLTAHRQTANCSYDNYGQKDELRAALVVEQRGLCCYCMGRIHNGPTTMKIEHWHCRDHYGREELNYRNMLGACLGGQGQPSRLHHCDTKKGNRNLQWNPADPAHRIERRIRYEMNGAIRSDDIAFDNELNQVLNLNLPVLKNNRIGVLTAVLVWWRTEKARLRGPVPRERFQRERDRYVGDQGALQPFCQVAVWWLDQRLARMQ